MAHGGASSRVTLRIGVLASLPKSIACRLVEPVIDNHVTLDLEHGPYDRLLESLAAGRLHAVLADHGPPQGTGLRLHGHTLGESELYVYGTERVRAGLSGRFPRCLHGAPMLLPRSGTTLRRQIERWLDERELAVRVIGEIDDAGTMRALGLRGHGLFPVRSALASEIADVTGARKIGAFDALRERYVAITRERTIRHPSLVRLVESARTGME
jgi:LysR family transcriptional activator of nhaA